MRLRYNGCAGTLGAAHNDSTTTLTLASKLTYVGGDVPTIAAGDYLPLSILDADGLCAEVVHVTAYTAAATTATVVRGRENTAAVAHDSGAVFVNAATALDAQSAFAYFDKLQPSQWLNFLPADKDCTTNRRDGTAGGDIAYTGRGLWMGGSSSSVNHSPSGGAFLGPSTLTVEVHITPASVSGIDGIVTVNQRYSLYLDDGVPKFRIYGSSAWQTAVASAAGALSANSGYHVAAVWDGTNQIIYVNGVQQGTSAPGVSIATGDPGSNQGYIGAEIVQSNGRLHGWIRHYALYGSVLTPAQIASNFVVLDL